ncbi:MAG: hypothetical protein V2J62_11850 [candidate division KSB1 bacterium]|jgi:hypothetical protein|nr:hypothetical protein [candidate division KSB1 bacterium]
MGKKDRTFAAKMAQGQEKVGKHCPECGELLNFIHLVDAVKSGSGNWKFKENMVGVCKCNEKEIYA